MRVHRSFACVVFLALASPAQDWQDCKPKGDYSFNDVKAAVHRVTSSRMYSGWDEKTQQVRRFGSGRSSEIDR